MWKNGTINIDNTAYLYEAKVHEENSEYGINGGRVSKLQIQRNSEIVCNFDRGWDIVPKDIETEKALQTVLKKFV